MNSRKNRLVPIRARRWGCDQSTCWRFRLRRRSRRQVKPATGRAAGAHGFPQHGLRGNTAYAAISKAVQGAYSKVFPWDLAKGVGGASPRKSLPQFG